MRNLNKLGLAMLITLLVSCNTNTSNSTSKNSNVSTPSSSQSVVKNQYTITFEENGGRAVNDITAIEGTSINLPSPTKENYSFDGCIMMKN